MLKAKFKSNSMYVCICAAVTEREVLEAIDQGAATVEEVSFCTGAGQHCGTCTRALTSIVDACTGDRREAGGSVHLRMLTSAA
jgi:bacterioferritin-associated ferredoxin